MKGRVHPKDLGASGLDNFNEMRKAMVKIPHYVHVALLFALCILVTACLEPRGDAGGFQDEFEVMISLPYKVRSTGGSTINDDESVAKVYAKVFNSAREHLPSVDEDGVTELMRGDDSWSAIVKLAAPASGMITFLVWAENSIGQHLYSGDGTITIPGSTSIIVTTEAGYSIGDMGPAGGYIFYDDAIGYDADDNGAVDSDERDFLDDDHDYVLNGERYLEAAPYGWYDGSDDPDFVFGYHRPEGTNVPVGTGSGVSLGSWNTMMLANTMRDNAYPGSSGDTTTSLYAAKICEDHVGGGYDDWFLPSKDELNQIYRNLYQHNLGGFTGINFYWSSSEYDDTDNQAWSQKFFNGGQYEYLRSYEFHVRPVRDF